LIILISEQDEEENRSIETKERYDIKKSRDNEAERVKQSRRQGNRVSKKERGK
jgi:hypothetical protein